MDPAKIEVGLVICSHLSMLMLGISLHSFATLEHLVGQARLAL
ncbi:MAG: hypothetical protein O3B10_04925 [Actinomycetota bacterium]|nr:hypothetical protein [Actinomycetota bacterium]